MKLIVTMLALCFLLKSNAQVPAPIVPAFTFFKTDNKTFTQLDLEKNKKLFLIFFDATCDHCHHALQYVSDHFSDFKDAAIYLISLDAHSTIKQVMNRYCPRLINKPQVTILRDVKNEFIQKFGPRKYPSLFLYSSRRQLLRYADDEKLLNEFADQIKM